MNPVTLDGMGMITEDEASQVMVVLRQIVPLAGIAIYGLIGGSIWLMMADLWMSSIAFCVWLQAITR